MSKLLRYYSGDNIYFVTVVTNERENLLIEHHNLFWDSVTKYEVDLRFLLLAYVVLPDHFHMIINPRGNNLSSIFQKIKLSFSKKIRFLSQSNSGHIWQSRFWDHIIRDQNDLNRHIDYIHYNPVKHGFVRSPFDWEYSSIHKFFIEGYYSKDWGVKESLNFEGNFGEWISM
jgi:putative transposase